MGLILENIILLIVLGIAAYFDLKSRKIPNKLIYSGLGIGLFLAISGKQYSKIILTIFSYLYFRIIYSINPDILPGGDIKMLVFIALIGGHDFFIRVLYYIIIFSVPFLIYYKTKEKKGGIKQTIPLAVPTLLACLFKLGGAYIVKFF